MVAPGFAPPACGAECATSSFLTSVACDRRDTRESCKSIDIRRWHREGRLRVGQQFPWTWTCVHSAFAA